MQDETKILSVIGGIVILVVLVLLLPFTTIGAGERGIVLRWGAVQPIVLNEGFHWLTPVADSVAKIDVKTQKHEAKASSYSNDSQTVEVDAALNYHVNPQTVNKMYQEIGSLDNVSAKIIDPNLQSAVKEVVSKYTAQGIIENREKVKDEIRIKLLAILNGSYVVVEANGLNITDINFDAKYEEAIRNKQIAQQNALTEKNKLESEKYKAEQTVVAAEAAAKAIEISAKAITQTGGAEYVNLKAVEKWNGVLPTQMIPGSAVPFINLNSNR